MKQSDSPRELLVRRAVRGDISPMQLKPIGVRVSGYDNILEIDGPRDLLVMAAPRDVACGLLRYPQHSPELKKWATFLLAASSIVDFAAIDESEYGEILIGALWDCSFTAACSSEAIDVAARLCGERTH